MKSVLKPLTEYTHGICGKSLVFKYYESSFYINGRFEAKKGFRLLKRKSCLQCNYCKYVHEALDIESSESDELPRMIDSLLTKKDYKFPKDGDEFTAYMVDEYEVVMVRSALKDKFSCRNNK